MTRGFLNHRWYKLLDEEGIPMPSASVWLYDYKNPTIQLTLFDVSGDPLTQPLSTDSEGILEFYVKDHISSSTDGYTWDTQFIISWSYGIKSGIIRGDHLFGEFESATLSGNVGRLNRAISNFVGWNVNKHVDFDFGTTKKCGSSSSSSSSVSSSSSSLSSSSSESVIPEFTFLLHEGSPPTGVVLENPASEKTWIDDYYFYRSAMLPDGRIVTCGGDDIITDDNDELAIRSYEAGTTTISWETSASGSYMYEYSDICVLNNGNIVALWWDDNGTDHPAFTILSPEGEVIVPPTNADTEATWAADEDYPMFVTPLDDGGFCVTWCCYGDIGITTWEANGTNREGTTWQTDPDGSYSMPIQMPGTGTYGGYMFITEDVNGYGFLYNPYDLSDYDDYLTFGHSGGGPIMAARSTLWNDRVLLIWADSGNTVGSIFDDTGDTIDNDHRGDLILSGVEPTDLVALPDGNFMIPFKDGVDEHGQSYYIIDTDWNIVSGPTTGITATLSNDPDVIHACAGMASSSSTSSSSSSISSSSSTSLSSSSSSESVSGGTWVSHFGTEKWEFAGYGTEVEGNFQSTHHASGFERVSLYPIGTWHVGLRPTKIRITCSPTVIVTDITTQYALIQEDEDEGVVFFQRDNYSSGTEVEFFNEYEWGSDDLSYYASQSDDGNVFTITNIEFYIE